MIFLITYGQPRPNILEDKKDEKYHGRWARYCVGQANNFLHTEHINKIKLNKAFYKGRQWIMDEDTESFLLDDENNARNRIPLKNDVFRPLVEQYRGNATRMNINAKVKAISPMAVSRRQAKLDEMYFYTIVANQKGNPFGENLKKTFPIGDSIYETEKIFDNIWDDTYVRDMNYLLKYIAELNRLPSLQPRIAEELCFSGLGVIKTYEYGSNQLFEPIESENFFWDRSNKLYNLTDCEFMGDIQYITPAEIFERKSDLDEETKEAIETFSRQYSKVGASVTGTNSTSSQINKYELGGRVPTFNTYWRDGDYFEYGYVRDKFGYPYFTRINFTYEGEDKPRYTDADLIEVDSIRAKKVLKGKKKARIYREVIRYCTFVPREILISASKAPKEDYYDVILDYGVMPYQETNTIDYIRSEFPYKAYCWAYVDGEVMSPLDACIDPQRFINRVLSVAENQINNSGGVNIAYDKSMVDPSGGESEIIRNIHQSKPIAINAKGRGMQNSIMPYDASVKAGTLGLFNVAETMKKFLQDTTGVNDALQGSTDNPDQLVGVTQLMIQRGSLTQEPFYNAIREIFLSCYQSMATMGKKIYADSERNLSAATGDGGVHVFRITEDMKLEDFACFVKIDNTDDVLAAQANAELLNLKQLGLIDDKRLAQLWGRSSPDEVASAMRAFAKEKEELARAQGKEEEQQNKQIQAYMEQQAQQQRQDAYEQQSREDIKDLMDKKHQMDSIYAKALGKIAQTNPEAEQQIINQNKKIQNQTVV